MKIDNGNDWFGGFARNEDLFFPLKVCALTQAEVHQSARYLVSSTITVITINSINILQPNPPGWCPVEDDDNLSLTAPVLR